MTTTIRAQRPYTFAIGERVYDVRDKGKTLGTVREQRHGVHQLAQYKVHWPVENLATWHFEHQLQREGK